MIPKWNEAKEKIKRKNQIQSLSDEIYNQTRKAPYHFESIKEYNAYDVMCRKRAIDEAIRRIVAKDMAGGEQMYIVIQVDDDDKSEDFDEDALLLSSGTLFHYFLLINQFIILNLNVTYFLCRIYLPGIAWQLCKQ